MAVLKKQLRIYLDSNVYVSVAKQEIGKNWRGLFVECEQFFDYVKKQNHVIVLSDWFFEEVIVVSGESKESIMDYFKDSIINIELVELSEEIGRKELNRLGSHHADAKHVAIAIRNKCDCIVTFNVKDFEKAKSRIKVFEPLSLLLEDLSF